MSDSSTSAYAVSKEPPASTAVASSSRAYNAFQHERTIEDTAKALRFWLKIDAGRNKCNSVLFSFLWFANILWCFLFFSAITDSVTIGSVLGALCIPWMVPAISAKHNKPAALAFFIDNPEAAERIAKACSDYWKSNVVMSLAFSLLCWIFFLGPFAEKKPFGEHSVAISATMFWVGWPLAQLSNCMCYLGDTVPVEVSKVWNTKITEYMEGIVQTLLDVEKGKSANFERLADAQSKVELFARNMNSILSTPNGLNNLLYIIWVFTMLALLAFPSNSSSSTYHTVQIGLLSFMSLAMSGFFTLQLVAITSPNRHWEKEKNRLLNDVRLQSLLGANGLYKFERFDQWLAQHELSSQRAFGIRVTQRLQRSLGSILMSSVAILLYVVLREEVRGLLS